MIGKTAQTVAYSVAGMGGLAVLGKFSYDTTKEITNIFKGKTETPVEATEDLSDRVTLSSAKPLNQTAPVSGVIKKNESSGTALPGASIEENGPSGTASANIESTSKAESSVSAATWMNSLDWATIAKATSVAFVALGIVGAAIMYAMGSKK